MRRRTKYILFIFMVLTLSSCDEYMELIPPGGLIKEEFWQNKGDVEAVLMASYQRFASMDRLLFVFGEARADMIEDAGSQDADERKISESNIYPDNKLCNWEDFYIIIKDCNEVIKNASLVQEVDNTFTDFERQGLEAEAYFLRSLAYFYLVRLYKEVPLILEPTESDDSEIYFEKSAEETILNQIINDLETNRPFAPSGGFTNDEENKGRASKAAFDALLADIALWNFDYEAVISHVEKIETAEDYVLLPDAKWFELFYPGNSLESIFEFQFDNNLDQRNATFGLTNQNSNRYQPSQKALELLSFDFSPELIRGQDASIKKYGEDEYIIWKYVGLAADGQSTRSGSEQNSCNWIVYRLADALLMKAEALSQMERYNESREIINNIRERAGMPSLSISNSTVAFEDAILGERAIELCFEGKRWFDLMRMGRRNNYARKSKLIEVVVSNVPSTQKRILAVKLTNPSGWYLPIYDEELERNKFLVQNPYYDF
jgi:starch-binding outer membrane protein, SusD/RagB family